MACDYNSRCTNCSSKTIISSAGAPTHHAHLIACQHKKQEVFHFQRSSGLKQFKISLQGQGVCITQL